MAVDIPIGAPYGAVTASPSPPSCRPSGRTLMVQGTGSSAGKSLLVTALVRLFRQEGFRVAPFKGQNMSLNSYPAADGGEIGRAQVVQAEAAGLPPSVHMNPVLLKPTSERGSQVIVHGRPIGRMEAYSYDTYKTRLLRAVQGSLDYLRARYELVVIEGAGSPAEINLRENDIVNMGVARLHETPVLLVTDIERGGVFASLYGTWALLGKEDRHLLRGFIINKFRGDPDILEPGLRELEERTGMHCAGVLPYLDDVEIDDEDSVSLQNGSARTCGNIRPVVSVIHLPRISNFTDFHSLEASGLFEIRYVSHPEELDDASLVVLPGTKSTVSDLEELRHRGFEQALVECRSRGIPVLGICGGFQMLGERILDAQHAESHETEVPGLGLLPMTTTFVSQKITEPVRLRSAGGGDDTHGSNAGGWWPHQIQGEGYEIHMGTSQVRKEHDEGGAGDVGGGGRCGPLLEIAIEREESTEDTDSGGHPYRPEGLATADGLVAGTYVHGLFDDFSVIAALARKLGIAESGIDSSWTQWTERHEAKEAAYDRLAGALRSHLDMDFIRSLVAEQEAGTEEAAEAERAGAATENTKRGWTE